jgi:hypothetical protein
MRLYSFVAGSQGSTVLTSPIAEGGNLDVTRNSHLQEDRVFLAFIKENKNDDFHRESVIAC